GPRLELCPLSFTPSPGHDPIRPPEVHMFFRRLRLATRYAWMIDMLMQTSSPGQVRATLLQRPELLSDDALYVVEMMMGKARRSGKAERAAGLAVIHRLLTDARRHGVDAAVAAIPPMGPL